MPFDFAVLALPHGNHSQREAPSSEPVSDGLGGAAVDTVAAEFGRGCGEAQVEAEPVRSARGRRADQTSSNIEGSSDWVFTRDVSLQVLDGVAL
jgi:hypothetical protein